MRWLRLRHQSSDLPSSDLPSRRRHGRDRIDDLAVTGAAAQIARDGVADLYFAWARILVEQRLGGEHDARRAEAALRAAMLHQRLLQRMQSAAGRKALDRGDGPPR